MAYHQIKLFGARKIHRLLRLQKASFYLWKADSQKALQWGRQSLIIKKYRYPVMHSTGTNQICGFRKRNVASSTDVALNGRIPLLIMTAKYQRCKVRLEIQQELPLCRRSLFFLQERWRRRDGDIGVQALWIKGKDRREGGGWCTRYIHGDVDGGGKTRWMVR